MNPKDLADIKVIKNRHSNHLLSLPNVTGVGVGPKIRNSQATGEIAIKVFVSCKVPLSKLQNKERIPKTIEDVPTDVEIIGTMKARNKS